MAQKDRLTLKSFFQQGDIPTENNYIDLIDSFFTLQDSNSGSLVLTGSIFLSGSNANFTASGDISASGDLSITGNTFISGNITSSGNVSASGNFTAAGLSVGGNIVVQQITASSNISASGDLEIRNITASGAISASGNVIAAEGIFGTGTTTINDSINTTGNITASGNINASGNITAANVRLPGGATISFDDSLDGTDQTISGTDDNITIDGDEKIKLRADNVIEIQNTSAENTIVISPNGGHITASGKISASNDIIAPEFHVQNTLGAGGYFIDTLGSKPAMFHGTGNQLILGGLHPSYVGAGIKLHTTGSDTTKGLFLDSVGNVTASCDISSSPTLIANEANIIGDITASNTTLSGILTAVSGNFQHISSSFIKTNNLVLSGSDGTEVVLNITNNSYSATDGDVGIQFKRKGNVVAADGQTVIEEAGKILASPAGNYNSSLNVDSNLEFYTMNNNTQSLHLTLDNVGNLSASGTGSFINLTLPGIPNVSSSLAAANAGGDNLGNHIATQTLSMGSGVTDGNEIRFITTASGYIEADGSEYAMLLSTRGGSKTEAHIDMSMDRGIILFASSSTNKNIIEIHGNITASGAISSSGNISLPDGENRIGGKRFITSGGVGGTYEFRDGSINVTAASGGHITASGNISASGFISASIFGPVSSSGIGTFTNLTVVSVTNTDRLVVDQIDEKNSGVGIKITPNITSSGAISASGAIFTSDLNVNYAALPTSDPSVKGQIYRNGSNQLFVSAG